VITHIEGIKTTGQDVPAEEVKIVDCGEINK